MHSDDLRHFVLELRSARENREIRPAKYCFTVPGAVRPNIQNLFTGQAYRARASVSTVGWGSEAKPAFLV